MLTVPAVAVNVAEEAPGATDTDAGTVKADEPEDREMLVALGAGPERETVQAAVAPAASEVGVQVTLVGVGPTEA